MRIKDKEIIEELKRIKRRGASVQERVRAEALLMSNDGKKSQEVADNFGVTSRTVFQWFKDFKEEGISSLKCSQGRGRKLILNEEDHLELVKSNIEKYPHQPKKAYAHTMEKLKIEMSYETFKRFLKKYSI